MDRADPPIPPPRSTHKTKEEAIVAALEGLEPGDRIWIHEQGCTSRIWPDRCNCQPEVLVVPEAHD